MTADIEQLEEEQARLEESLATAVPTADGTLQERTKRYEHIRILLEEKNARWEYLADLA